MDILALVRCASGSPLTVKQGADQDAVALEQMISVLPFKIATARASEHRGGLYVGRVARDQKHRLHRSRGTEGSNPSPSGGEMVWAGGEEMAPSSLYLTDGVP